MKENKEVIIDNPFKVNIDDLPKVKNHNAIMKAIVSIAKENGWEVLWQENENSIRKVYKAR